MSNNIIHRLQPDEVGDGFPVAPRSPELHHQHEHPHDSNSHCCKPEPSAYPPSGSADKSMSIPPGPSMSSPIKRISKPSSNNNNRYCNSPEYKPPTELVSNLNTAHWRSFQPHSQPPSFIRTQHANRQLVLDGYVYNRERQRGMHRCYWQCSLRKKLNCRARATTDAFDNPVRRPSGKEFHIHPPKFLLPPVPPSETAAGNDGGTATDGVCSRSLGLAQGSTKLEISRLGKIPRASSGVAMTINPAYCLAMNQFKYAMQQQGSSSSTSLRNRIKKTPAGSTPGEPQFPESFIDRTIKIELSSTEVAQLGSQQDLNIEEDGDLVDYSSAPYSDDFDYGTESAEQGQELWHYQPQKQVYDDEYGEQATSGDDAANFEPSAKISRIESQQINTGNYTSEFNVASDGEILNGCYSQQGVSLSSTSVPSTSNDVGGEYSDGTGHSSFQQPFESTSFYVGTSHPVPSIQSSTSNNNYADDGTNDPVPLPDTLQTDSDKGHLVSVQYADPGAISEFGGIVGPPSRAHHRRTSSVRSVGRKRLARFNHTQGNKTNVFNDQRLPGSGGDSHVTFSVSTSAAGVGGGVRGTARRYADDVGHDDVNHGIANGALSPGGNDATSPADADYARLFGDIYVQQRNLLEGVERIVQGQQELRCIFGQVADRQIEFFEKQNEREERKLMLLERLVASTSSVVGFGRRL